MVTEPDRAPESGPTGIEGVVTWLVEGARSAPLPQDILDQLCVRLVECGLPLHRVAVFVRTLHPNVMGRRFVWRPGAPVEVTAAPFSILDSDSFRLGPIPKVVRDAAPLRRRIADPDGPDDFPVLEELRAEGVTDYLALPLVFTDGTAHAVTWTTTRPGGFTDAHITALEAVQAPPRPRRRDLRPAPHGDQPPQHLCRPGGGRAHPRGPHPARRCRGHRRRHLPLRSARLQHPRQRAAGEASDRAAQRLFRLHPAGNR